MQIDLAGKDTSHMAAWLAANGIDLRQYKGAVLAGDMLTVPDDATGKKIRSLLAAADWPAKAKKVGLSDFAREVARRRKILGGDAKKLDTIKEDLLVKIASGAVTEQAVIDAEFSQVPIP